MSAVDLDRIETNRLNTLCSLSVFLNSCKDFFLCHRTRNFSADLCRNVGRRNSFHSGSCRRSRSSGMVDLNCYSSAILMKVLYQLIITRHKAVVIDTDLTCTVGTCRIFNVGILQNDKACTSLCTKRVIIHMTVTHLAACLTVVGSHRSHSNTVFDCCSFNCYGFKNLWVFTLHEIISLFINIIFITRVAILCL